MSSKKITQKNLLKNIANLTDRIDQLQVELKDSVADLQSKQKTLTDAKANRRAVIEAEVEAEFDGKTLEGTRAERLANAGLDSAGIEALAVAIDDLEATCGKYRDIIRKLEVKKHGVEHELAAVRVESTVRSALVCVNKFIDGLNSSKEGLAEFRQRVAPFREDRLFNSMLEGMLRRVNAGSQMFEHLITTRSHDAKPYMELIIELSRNYNIDDNPVYDPGNATRTVASNFKMQGGHNHLGFGHITN